MNVPPYTGRPSAYSPPVGAARAFAGLFEVELKGRVFVGPAGKPMAVDDDFQMRVTFYLRHCEPPLAAQYDVAHDFVYRRLRPQATS